jgi:tetratricopeptide (TPR) repeat protein
MQNQNKKAVPQSKDSAGNMIFVGIICLAIGLAVGYYFGKTAGSSALPIAASGPMQSAPPSQSPLMDPATFQQNEASFKSMLSANPKDSNAMVQLGNLYYDNNRFSEAIDWYGRALEIDSKNIDARTDRGSCYWSLGKADEAIGEFQKSLQINPTHSQTLYNMGIVYLHGKNDMNQARQYWEKLLATNPNYPERSRLQSMLAAMTPSPEAPPAPSANTGQTGQTKAGSSSMEDLFKRMKK